MQTETNQENRTTSKITLKNRKNRKKQVQKRKEDKQDKEKQLRDLMAERDVLLVMNENLKKQWDEKVSENLELKKELKKAEKKVCEYENKLCIQEGELLLLDEDYDM